MIDVGNTPGRPARLDPVLALLRAKAGLAFGPGRDELAWAAVGRAAAARGESVDAYADALLRGEVPLAPLLDQVTVGETYFFRDPAQWTFIEEVVLPDRLARRGPQEPLRCWSAGCASGEEPYTLAALLLERGLAARGRIVATDLSAAALERARRAEYSPWSLRGGADARLRRHLRTAGARVTLDPEVTRLVRFSELNLAEPGFPSAERGLDDLDLVLCRNVLIYLDRAVVAEVGRRFFDALAPGGWLLLGASDPSLARAAPFLVDAGRHGVAYQRPPRLGAGTERARDDRARRPAVELARRGSPVPAGPTAAAGRVPGPGGAGGGRLDRPALADPIRAPRTSPRAGIRAAAEQEGSGPPLPAAALDDEADLACASCRALLDAGRLGDADRAIAAALARRPLAPGLHLMRALVAMERGDLAEAEAASRRALYLDRTAPLAHFLLATLRLQRGDREAARRGFVAARRSAERLPAEAPVPFSAGLNAGALAIAARFQLEGLGER